MSTTTTTTTTDTGATRLTISTADRTIGWAEKYAAERRWRVYYLPFGAALAEHVGTVSRRDALDYLHAMAARTVVE